MPLHRLLVFTGVLALGCRGEDDATGGSDPLKAVDADDDGYADSVDCDDTNPAVNPAAEELCDGIDNDCDAAIDEDVGLNLYIDADGDGFGDPAAPTVACEVAAGLSEQGTDCDDSTADINPAAEELCDGIDNDCDVEVDEGAGVLAYEDIDDDGFGNPDSEGFFCELPAGWVTEGGDCDDIDAATFPGADEVCDGADNNCNGVADDDEAIDRVSHWPDADGDGYGDATASESLSCAVPSGAAGEATDCDDALAAVNPGATEVCNGLDDNCDGASDDVDLDGDGFFDATCTDGTDCDDTNPAAFPGATEVWYDGIDQDCAADDDYDQDADSYVPDAYAGLTTAGVPGSGGLSAGDCDDTQVSVNPAVVDTWYDGIDQDCAGNDDYDQDADSYVDDTYVGRATLYASGTGALPGGDCDDTDSTFNPGATDAWYDGIDNDCAEDDDYDADADGYVPDVYAGLTTALVPGSGSLPANDCDDTNVSINPAATETWYDGTDQDCAQDDDYDADVDGYVPTAYAGLGTTGVTGTGGLPDNDCDDTDASVNPAATETWYDGIDQDCDSANDYDADQDGYTTSVDYFGGDCDDADSSINPGATEVCDDGIDNDCDGGSNTCSWSGDIPVTDADAYFYGEAAVDRLGQGDPGVSPAGDLNGDGIEDLLISAIFDDDNGTNSGRTHVLFGPVSGVGAGISVSDVQIDGEAAGDLFGRSLAKLGDVDGDGFDDVLISAQGDATQGSNTGAAWLLNGPLSAGSFTIDSASAGAAKFTGAAAGDLVADLAPAGDVDGDGYADFLITAQFLDQGTTDGGGAYLIYGPATTASYDLGSPLSSDARFLGENDGDEAGSAIWGGDDLDGDGTPDVLLAARYADDGTETDNGAVYAVFGPMSGDVSLASADVRFAGEDTEDELGYGASVSSAGDVNNDGYTDIIAGARFNSRGGTKSGSAYLVLGPLTSGTATDISSADAIFVGEAAADQTGDSVAGPGDIDGDGNDDLLIGSGWNDAGTTNGGAGYLIFGPVSASTGVVDLADADARFLPEGDNDRLRITSGGDLNADGKADLLIATQNNATNTATAGNQHGAAYLFYGTGL